MTSVAISEIKTHITVFLCNDISSIIVQYIDPKELYYLKLIDSNEKELKRLKRRNKTIQISELTNHRKTIKMTIEYVSLWLSLMPLYQDFGLKKINADEVLDEIPPYMEAFYADDLELIVSCNICHQEKLGGNIWSEFNPYDIMTFNILSKVPCFSI